MVGTSRSGPRAALTPGGRASRARPLRPSRAAGVAAVVAAALVLASCGPLRPIQRPIAEALVPVEQERQLGDQVARDLEAEVDLDPDPELQAYVQELGDRVVSRADDAPEGMAYRFRVIDEPDQVNALALPGGHVYVFSGLLLAAEDEAEVAGVIAHETAHVTQRHIAEQLVAQFGLEALAQIALGRDPGAVRQIATVIAARGALTSFSREAEREADDYGVLYMARAGWSPQSYARFFDRLAEMSDRPEVLAFLETHPRPDERAENARALIASLERVPTFTGEDRLARVTARIDRRAAAARETDRGRALWPAALTIGEALTR